MPVSARFGHNRPKADRGWANIQRDDFAPVFTAYKALERSFSCPACGEPLYVVLSGKEKEVVRCACSKVTLNLKAKK